MDGHQVPWVKVFKASFDGPQKKHTTWTVWTPGGNGGRFEPIRLRRRFRFAGLDVETSALEAGIIKSVLG